MVNKRAFDILGVESDSLCGPAKSVPDSSPLLAMLDNIVATTSQSGETHWAPRKKLRANRCEPKQTHRPCRTVFLEYIMSTEHLFSRPFDTSMKVNVVMTDAKRRAANEKLTIRS